MKNLKSPLAPLFQRGKSPHLPLVFPIAHRRPASPAERDPASPLEKGGLRGICRYAILRRWNDGVAA